MTCKHCEQNSHTYSYQCFGCVAREIATMPKISMAGYAKDVCNRFGHDYEELQQAYKKLKGKR